MATRLGVPEIPGQLPADAIADHVADQPVLLVLDNCEHVPAAVADLVAQLLALCPACAILATSRAQLGVEGERAWAVPPLSGAMAVELFQDRARLVAPAFTVDEANRDLVWHVCDRLDRLPLAIELAAARLRVLSARQLAERISDVFGVLTEGSRSAPARHQTLRATLDWSHDLLTAAERTVFRRLSVFAGGFTLAAAEHVAADSDIPAWSVLDLLAKLADKSLLRVETERYQFLSVIREYAREQLVTTGEADRARRAHLAYYTGYAEELGSAVDRAVAGELETILDSLDAEKPNFRAALDHARQVSDPVAALRIAGALSRYAYLRGHYAEVRQWLDDAVTASATDAVAAVTSGSMTGAAAGCRAASYEVLSLETGAYGILGADPVPAVTPPAETPPAETPPAETGEHASLRARALLGSGRLAHLQCDYGPAIERLDAALALYQELGDSAGTAAALQALGSVAREQGEYARSAQLHAECLDRARAAGDKRAEASARGYLGFACWLQGDLDRAASECQAALAGFRSMGDVEGIAWSLLSLAVVARYGGDLSNATAALAESLALAESIGFREGIAWCLEQLGLIALAHDGTGTSGDCAAEAAGMLGRSFVIHSELRDRWRMASVLEDLAAVCAGTRSAASIARAARLLGAAQALRDSIGTVIAPVELPQHQATVTAARQALGAAAFDTAWRRGLLAPDLDADVHGDVATAGAQVAGGRGEVLDAEVLDAEVLDKEQGGALGVRAPRATPERSQLRVRALGAASVELGGVPLTAADWGYAKPRELLFLLVTSVPLTREQIGAALWPELSRQQLGNALHTALREVRRALGSPERVLYAGGRYAVNRELPMDCDVDEFESAMAGAGRARPASAALPALQRALAAYGGDFLAGMACGEWGLARREELRRRFESALLAAGRLQAAACRHQAAAGAFRRAIEHEPLNETAHRELMTCWEALGETARAVRHYQQLTALLRDQAGVAPAAETTALYKRLVSKA